MLRYLRWRWMIESALLGFSEFTRGGEVGTADVVRAQDQRSHQVEIGLRAAQQCGGPELPLPDWARVRAELSRKGVTLHLLWREYRSEHPDGYGYSQFCELYGRLKKVLGPTMRQTHRAGEGYVAYAGVTMPVVDPETGEVREAQIFV